MPIVRVALDVPLSRLFDYRADDAVATDVGRLVVVPFGGGAGGHKVGLIVGSAASSDQPAGKLKPVETILRDMPPLPADWLALCEFCSRYYQHPLGQVMGFALPPLLRRGKLPRNRAKGQGARDKEGDAVQVPPLLPEQQAAVEAITAARGFGTFLLHGITGSGKTEVYLRAIEAVLAARRPGIDAGAGNRSHAATGTARK